MARFFGRRAVLFALALSSLAQAAWATGPYVFGAFGARRIFDQDMNEFFALGSQPGPEFTADYLGDASLVVGYRFSEPFALEAGLDSQMGREFSNLNNLGNVDLQVPTGGLVSASLAPVFCFDTVENVSSAWFHQVGFRVSLAHISGLETIDSGSGGGNSLDFSGSAVGWGVFYRLINLWAPSKLSVGVETGYEVLTFTHLGVSGGSGVFSGAQELVNLNDVPAYLDNSGPYLKLVVGWCRESKHYMGSQGDSADGLSGPALLDKARIATKQGDLLGGVSLYRRYLDEEPKDADVWRELAAVYASNHQDRLARQCRQRADKIKPSNP